MVEKIKNNTRPVNESIFPNIDIREAAIYDDRFVEITSSTLSTQNITLEIKADYTYHIQLRTLIPVIRGGVVYLIPLFLRREYPNVIDVTDKKKQFIKELLIKVEEIQLKYEINEESLKDVFNWYWDTKYYKMDYGI